jgi:hypothetical protein
MLVIVMVTLMILLLAGFLYFRPKPEGAIDKGSSPAAAPR